MASIARRLIALLVATWCGETAAQAAKLTPEQAVAILSSSIKCLNTAAAESNATCKFTADTEKMEIHCSTLDTHVEILAITQKYMEITSVKISRKDKKEVFFNDAHCGSSALCIIKSRQFALPACNEEGARKIKSAVEVLKKNNNFLGQFTNRNENEHEI